MLNTTHAESRQRATTAPLHVAVVTETFPPEVNGVAHTLSRLTDGLLERGHRLQIVRPRQGETHPECSANVATHFCPGVGLPGYRGLRMGLASTGRLLRLWREQRPDIVYVATEGLLGRSAVGAAARLGIPSLSGFHTNFHAYSRHYGAGLLRRPIYSYLRNLHNRSACTLVPTDELRQALTAAEFENVEVLGRGVDGELFSPQRRNDDLRRAWGLRDGDRAVLHVGRLAPEKNLSLLLCAFDAMQAVDPRLRLVIVGDGPSYEELYRRHRDIVFCGARRGVELAEHYASGDIFLFPSETETFGNVTPEAMASGLAVVAFDYAAARIMIADGVDGLLAPLGDESAFIGAGLRLARDGELVQRLRRAARRRALQHDWGTIVERFEGLLARVAGKGGA